MRPNAFIFVYMWEITDLDRPISVLIAEAEPQLGMLARQCGGRLLGPPRWAIAHERLVCRAPARPLRNDEHIVDYQGVPAQMADEMREMVRRGTSKSAVARAFGVDRKTVIKHTRRAA